MKSPHELYLDRLVNHLHEIDENIRNACWIMKEGLYLKNNSENQKKLCDLIIGYYNNSISLIELKGTKNKKDKARIQLLSGFELATECFGYDKDDVVMKAVYYTNSGYEYEIIER